MLCGRHDDTGSLRAGLAVPLALPLAVQLRAAPLAVPLSTVCDELCHSVRTENEYEYWAVTLLAARRAVPLGTRLCP